MSDVVILELKDTVTIKGNCTIAGYVDQILLNSYSHSVSLPLSMTPTNAERTLGKPRFSEMSFDKVSDVSTAPLYEACVKGTKLGKAKIHVGRQENGKWMSYLEYELANAMISSIATGGGGGSAQDRFSINFTEFSMTYTQQKSDSTKKGVADFKYNLEEEKEG